MEGSRRGGLPRPSAQTWRGWLTGPRRSDRWLHTDGRAGRAGRWTGAQTGPPHARAGPGVSGSVARGTRHWLDPEHVP